ncbi:MAG: uroporphyrinogen decarboxylase family protein [Akkermansiaceae bacterium]|nr:uroporphyrinogen decarboxylase family protein [Akkermansiaceae bacterium]
MTSRQRLQAALDHQQPDRVPVDIGATFVTGIHVSALAKLRRAVLGEQPGHRIKVAEPYQMLGEVDDELREALGIDVIGSLARKSIFGTDESAWKPFTFWDGTELLVPHNFNLTIEDGTGDWLAYPEGDMSAAPSGRLPKGGYFFDAIIRQQPIDEESGDITGNIEEFKPFGAAEIAFYEQRRDWFREHSDCGVSLVIPGTAFGDIALVPAPFLRDPKGVRDISEWYMATAARPEFVRDIFEHQCQVGLANLETLIGIFGDLVQVVVVTGTDFGTQRGPFIKPSAYCDLYMPFHRRVNDLIHAKTNWKSFIHSCGSVYDFLPDFIEAGFDVLNPVQCSAAKMDPRTLKREFGKHLTFWGGGVDTQKTLPFGTPDEVYREVRERIDIFGEGGGFVFNTIHNIQGPTPTENLLAMFRAIKDSGQ